MDASREVPPQLLLEILQDAHWAPSHGLTQPWRFHVFTGRARERLAEGLQGLYDRLTPPGERRPDKRDKLGTLPRLAPVCVAVLARVIPGGKIPEREEIAATACAVQNLLLSAHQHGLGSFWSSPPVSLTPEFAAWLGADASHLPMGVVYLGYPRPGPSPQPAPRDPLSAHVVFHES